MLLSIAIFLFYLLIAVLVIEVIFWILSLIFAGFIIAPRIRGLVYAILLICAIIWALEHFGAIH